MKPDVNEWMRVSAYVERTGDPENAVYSRIFQGVWAEGLHYKRTSPRTLWINHTEVMRWIEGLPSARTDFPKGLRSVQGSGATASG
jgi:hypothetical protein